MKIPAFIISFNRGKMLEQCISGIRQMRAEIDIIVHDNGSDGYENLLIIDRLSDEGVHVVKRDKITSADDLNNTNDTITDYFSARECSPYIVSDCDIDLAGADDRAISVYIEMLDRFPSVECVGPMLTIRDIPRSYPLYARVMNRHVEQFWGKHPDWCDTSIGKIAYQLASIDTMLAVHRAGMSFRRLKNGLRVYNPFEARHLDWYITNGAQDVYNLLSSLNISHWNNSPECAINGGATHAYDKYIIVDHSDNGILMEKS